MKRVCHKLVRDNIPELIRAQGNKPVVRVMEREEYRKALMEKLKEEAEELEETPCLEELCDVLEVVKAIAREYQFSREQLAAAMEEKARRNGAFERRLLLEAIEFHTT